MTKNIYVSYAWKEPNESLIENREEIVNKLCRAFERKGYHILRDKDDMKYRDAIREFMNDISRATALIAIISEKYLRSPYCMYELTSAWDKGDFHNRIFPIVLSDAKILFDPSEQIKLVKYWEDEYKAFDRKVAGIEDVVAKEGFLQKLRDIEYIYQRASGAMNAISGMVVIEPEKLLENRFTEIIIQIENQLKIIQPINQNAGFLKTLRRKFERTSEETGQTDLTEKQRYDFITQLKKRYEDRLKQKLDDRIAIDLELQYTLQGVNKKNILHLDDEAKTEKDIQDELTKIFIRHPFLLILGQPGAGKTTYLLNMAVGLLGRVQLNKEASIPVIFNLATWTEDSNPFEKWLKETLVSMYGYPKALAEKAINDNKIIPLLDGFDEVGNHLGNNDEKDSLRNRCLAAIQNYKNIINGPENFVICSRIVEYEKAGGNAPVSAQILVKPVTADQIRKTLEEIRTNPNTTLYKNADATAAANLLMLFEQNTQIQNVLCTPFYFNAPLQVLNQRGDSELVFPNEIEQLKGYMEKEYVNRKLNTPNKKYKPENIAGYLKWISHWLTNQQNVNFELALFQPAALRKPNIYKLLGAAVLGLLFGLVMGLFTFLTYNFMKGLVFFISFSFIGSIWFLYSNRKEREIKTKDMRKWDWKRLQSFKTCLSILVIGIVGGGGLGLLLGLVYGVIGALEGAFKSGFIEGLVLGFVFGFVFGLVAGLENYISEIVFFFEIGKPYYRLTAELKREPLKHGVITFVLAFFYSYFLKNNAFTNSLSAALGTGLLVSIISFLLSPLYKHFILNYCLWREKSLPLPLVPFFDYCVSLRLLEKDGGSWRFRHQILQNYFSNIT